jgi:hypothetical protein
MFAPLSELATVNLGFKSLQNNFFYVNKATVDTYSIEAKFTMPIYRLADLAATSFRQQLEATTWLLNCREKKGDLRATGTLRYIEAMAGRSAAERKQTGKSQTIREALEAQAGGLWYAPKARPAKHHIWLRKAIDGVYSPFLFEKGALVDQRCNSVSPRDGITWQELAAVLTSSLFAYSLEINGAASMGAGALEAPTTKLRDYPVFDVRRLSKADRATLVTLAEKVWTKEAPIDWKNVNAAPGKNLRALDAWLLEKAGKAAAVTPETLHADIRDACRARIHVAKDKSKKKKKATTENIANVADSIVQTIKPRIEMRRFPEDYASGAPSDISLHLNPKSIRRIVTQSLLGSCDLTILGEGDTELYGATLPQATAEAITRALLWGRSAFSVSNDAQAMNKAVSDFLEAGGEIEAAISMAIAESALGTGYEEALKREIYARLGVHPLALTRTLPATITLGGA